MDVLTLVVADLVRKIRTRSIVLSPVVLPTCLQPSWVHLIRVPVAPSVVLVRAIPPRHILGLTMNTRLFPPIPVFGMSREDRRHLPMCVIRPITWLESKQFGQLPASATLCMIGTVMSTEGVGTLARRSPLPYLVSRMTDNFTTFTPTVAPTLSTPQPEQPPTSNSLIVVQSSAKSD